MDTDPIDIKDLSCLDHIGKLIIKSLRNNLILLQTENNILNEKLSQKEREIAERYKEMKSQFDAMKNTETSLTESTTGLEHPTEDKKQKPKGTGHSRKKMKKKSNAKK